MGSKVKINERRQASATIAKQTKTSLRDPKIQKLIEQNGKICENQSIASNLRYQQRRSFKRSPASIHESTDAQEEQESFGQLDLPPSISILANPNFDTIVSKREENAPVSDTIRECDDGKNILSAESWKTYGEYRHDEASTTMIVDNNDNEENEDCPMTSGTSNKSSSLPSLTSHSHINRANNKAFCPNRMPRRSSLKGSDGAETLSPSSKKQSSMKTAVEKIEVLLPGRRQPIQRRRSITFHNRVDIQKIEPVQLLTTDGPESLWYQQNEYDSIKIKTLALLNRVEHSSGILDGRKYCTRGLEKFMAPEVTEVKKQQAWDSVLNEQYLQRKDGEYDEESLANIYKYSTKRSRSEASKRATHDAEVAQAYYLKAVIHGQCLTNGWEARTNFSRRLSM
mmetsp:Transcript_19822/g.44541  ORF Transcript_19822/g.44541 Transcript_19822/m.44541 type:complete len:397 (+) Transcript_19822:103-1293(+)|eukprot:CAMPEP_0201119370 /NCGR_PEP_ID=MMETSP0850-20130426/3521_1 /ASSEMBLY_ACC=CAM_ASM_000622 /TAXON_ID=183588 /ORGANISM="Pseudo-nitzschia fraudulenta, Strain WWA7" /LENGTH=396 /DNA_ID=CAMNT_0047385051 /DNA_START=51 /DNA_END=1241 /DNA_ORIENTATION=-